MLVLYARTDEPKDWPVRLEPDRKRLGVFAFCLLLARVEVGKAS